MVGWGLQSHFHVQPNFSDEVVLCCRWGCDNSDSRGTNYSTVSTSILPNIRVSGLALKIFASVEGRTRGKGKPLNLSLFLRILKRAKKNWSEGPNYPFFGWSRVPPSPILGSSRYMQDD